MEEKPSSSGTTFLVGLLIGAVVGGAAGVLLAPAKGADVRKKVKQSLSSLYGAGGDIWSEAQASISAIFDKLKTGGEHLKEGGDRIRHRI